MHLLVNCVYIFFTQRSAALADLRLKVGEGQLPFQATLPSLADLARSLGEGNPLPSLSLSLLSLPLVFSLPYLPPCREAAPWNPAIGSLWSVVSSLSSVWGKALSQKAILIVSEPRKCVCGNDFDSLRVVIMSICAKIEKRSVMLNLWHCLSCLLNRQNCTQFHSRV